ncbi:MAG TPA: carbohydrate ABC transporter permease [Streptosporangiaceae bacterium]|jgi:raffinose/stachyose/melibiose transport system permease protein
MSTILETGRARPGPARPGPQPARRGRRISPLTPVTYLAAILLIGVTVVPLLFVFVDGFKTNAQINSSATGLPHPWDTHNYAQMLTSSLFWQPLGNSAVIAAIATVLVVVLGAMAAFALSRYAFPGREGLFLLFAVGLLFPLNAAALPLYLMLGKLGLLDNPLGVALPEAAFGLPITIVILRPFMREIPGELEDAAVVDGATRIGFFLRILLPLSRPALVTVAVLAFVQSWNQYLIPLLVFTSQGRFTLPLAVANFQTQYAQNTASILAFTALSMLPALGCFIFAQRHLVGGFTGAVKG